MSVRKCVKFREQGVLQQSLSFGLLGAVDIHLGLDDGHQARREDLRCQLELLVHDFPDAVPVGLLDQRPHLRPEDVFCVRLIEQRLKLGHRLHQLDSVLLLDESLVHLEERDDPLHVPEIIRGRPPLDIPVHRVLKQDSPQDSFPGKARAGNDARAHLMDEGIHAFFIAPSVFDTVGRQGLGGTAPALVKGGDKTGVCRHSLKLLLVRFRGIHATYLICRSSRFRLLVEFSQFSSAAG